ncbi:MAG: hypothetical protein M3377_11005 [Actinomycetota bacterium]|nr:hypothetical protein [Actinomycetota bacterium]
MSPLYLVCVLCGRRQAEGLLSRGAWGHVELEGGGAVRACPHCKGTYPDWERRVVAVTGGRVGAVYAPDGEVS